MFSLFATTVYFMLHFMYGMYKGRVNQQYFISTIRNIAYMYVYNNYSYMQFVFISFTYSIVSTYVYFVHGISI